MTAGRLDALGAAAAGGTAFAVYARTLAPGLVGVVDTPMFQFIGRVLGVPHNPGYPLYVLLTHLFSYLPIGSLAYRINLFSALLGAVAVSLTFLAARQLGCRPVISLAAALGLAFGHIFWSQSVIAEVYTLNAAIVAAMLLTLLLWGRTQRSGFFFAAIALFGVGLGNHTTIVAFAPGMAAYALLTNRRFVLRRRTLLIVVAILAAGLAQYGFIILRSRQPDVYVESRAETVSELLQVMTGAQFGDRLFQFEWRVVFFDRLPWLVERVLATELTLAGLMLAIAGAAWLLWRRLPEALLLLLGCGAIVGFALNYDVIDTPVFVIPATLVMWLLAAVGIEQAARTVGRQRRVAAVVGLAALVLPGWHFAGNLAATDRSRDTDAAVHMDGLFDVLPDRAALVHEDFLVDRMVMFKLLGDDAARGRRIEVTRRHADTLRGLLEQGVSVFGFQKSVRTLRHDGLDFGFAPLPVTGGRLPDLLSRLRDGTVVALSMPARDAERIARAGGLSFVPIGGPHALDGAAPSNVVIVGVRGASRGALVRTGALDVGIDVRPGGEIGETRVGAVSAIEVMSGPAEAVIRQGSRDLVRTADGAAVALWNAAGRLEHAFVLDREDDYRVPLKTGPLSVYPLRGVWSSQAVRVDAWTDVLAAVRTGSVMLRVPARATVLLYCGDNVPLAPRIVDRSSDSVSVDITPVNHDRTARPARRDTDELQGTSLHQSAHLYRIQINASGPARGSVLLALGGVPTQAVARVTQSASSGEATAFSVDTRGLLRTPDRATEVLLMARDDQAQLTGHGWSAVDRDAFTSYRWMTATEARLVLPIGEAAPGRIRVQALLDEEGAATNLRLRLNETELPSQRLRKGWHTYEWTLDEGTLRPGTNEASVVVDRLSSPDRADVEPRGVAVTDVRVIQGRR